MRRLRPPRHQGLNAVSGVVDSRVPTWRAGRATVLAEASVDDAALMGAVEEAGSHAVVLGR